MIFKTARDWKTYLNIEDEKHLNKLLEKAAKHRGAYKNSSDVKTAQVWCAFLELKKENLILQKRLRYMESVFDGISDKLKLQEQRDRELIRSLETF